MSEWRKMKDWINISKGLSPVSSSSLSASSVTPVGTWRQPWPVSRPWKIHQALLFPSRSPRSSPASPTPGTTCIFFSYFKWFAHLLILSLQRFNWIIFLQISHGGRLNPEKSHFTKKKSHLLNNLAVVAPVEVWDTLDEENSENFRSKPPGPRPIEECLTDSMSWRGNLVELVLCVLLGHPNSKIANSMKLVTFAFFSSQYHVFELKNIRGNLIAPNSNRWSLSNENAMSQEDNRKIISLFGQEKSIFLHPWMLKDLI